MVFAAPKLRREHAAGGTPRSMRRERCACGARCRCPGGRNSVNSHEVRDRHVVLCSHEFVPSTIGTAAADDARQSAISGKHLESLARATRPEGVHRSSFTFLLCCMAVLIPWSYVPPLISRLRPRRGGGALRTARSSRVGGSPACFEELHRGQRAVASPAELAASGIAHARNS